MSVGRVSAAAPSGSLQPRRIADVADHADDRQAGTVRFNDANQLSQLPIRAIRVVRGSSHSELFATAISHLSADAANTWPARGTSNSPLPQVSGQFGDLIGQENGSDGRLTALSGSSQVIVCVALTPNYVCRPRPGRSPRKGGLIRHAAARCGEQFKQPRAATSGRGACVDRDHWSRL